MRVTRADDSKLGRWWLTIDRALLGAILALLAAGIVLALASSPAVAIRKGLPSLYFAERHIAFAAVGVVVMLAVSLLSARGVRRLALGLFLGGAIAMLLVLIIGEEINGARRWLRLWGLSLQPSELAKPGFAVLAAWAFAESERRPDMPAVPIAIALHAVLATLLVLQPDIGQTLLVTAVWVALLVLTGRGHILALVIAILAAVGLVAAYLALPHVRARIDRFVAPVHGDNSQLDRAWQSFAEGGLLGRGPGEGTIKTVLPDAHTDFVLAVVAEEFGALACLMLVALIGAIVLRPLLRAAREHDGFIRHATVALSLMIGLQALINLGTNVGLVPAKGMTLPFVSVGGSSMIAVAITSGMLIALTRRRADARSVRWPGLPRVISATPSAPR